MTSCRGKFIYAPQLIASDKSLSYLYRMFLLIIHTLSYNPNRFCFAKNRELGKLIGLENERKIRQIISDLEKLQFIRVEFEGRIRKIFPLKYFMEAQNEPAQKEPVYPAQKEPPPPPPPNKEEKKRRRKGGEREKAASPPNLAAPPTPPFLFEFPNTKITQEQLQPLFDRFGAAFVRERLERFDGHASKFRGSHIKKLTEWCLEDYKPEKKQSTKRALPLRSKQEIEKNNRQELEEYLRKSPRSLPYIEIQDLWVNIKIPNQKPLTYRIVDLGIVPQIDGILRKADLL